MDATVKSSDSGKIILMLTIGFFTGIFVSTLEVGASTLFLDKFDEQAYLPKAIIISGLLGITFTYLFAYLQIRTDFATLSAIFYSPDHNTDYGHSPWSNIWSRS